MTRARRRSLVGSISLGLLLTIGVVIADASGMLDRIERALYDIRAQHCQIFAPPPTDKLIHLDIDDRALESIGEWPWPRSVEAQLIDEMDRAGVKAIGWDVIFPDAQPVRYEPKPDGTFAAIDDDATFADAIRRSGKVLLPISIQFESPDALTPLQKSIWEALSTDPELSEEALTTQLRAKGFTESDLARLGDDFVPMRATAIRKKVNEALSHGNLSFEQLRAAVLPKLDPRVTGSPLLRVLDAQQREVDAEQAAAALVRPATPGAGALLLARSQQPNVAPLMHAASATGFVDFVQSPDGVIRTIPLWAEYDGRQYPQLGLSMACMMMGVDLKDVKIEPSRVTIPRPKVGDLVIPVRTSTAEQLGTKVGSLMDVPFFGRDNWATAYDYPKHQLSRQHLSVNAIWEACQFRQKIASNNASIDQAILVILSSIAPGKAKAYHDQPPAPEDVDARLPKIQSTLDGLDASPLKDLLTMKDSELTEDQRAQRDELKEAQGVLKTAAEKNRGLASELQEQRAALHTMLNDKAVLIGFIATGKVDVVVTPIVRRCPGVVVQGIVFNSVMTGWFIKTPGAWAGILFTLLIGIATTAAVSFLEPKPAVAVVGGLVLGYALLNGYIFYDWRHWNVPMAGPTTVAVTVVPMCILARLISERTQRQAIQRRFSGYADPSLVDYVIEHPEQIRFEGQVREMTVVFVDIASFTSISEQLGERVVKLLNFYLEAMVPVARGRGGLVNKFIGDGMLLFFGAPAENLDHAADAVGTVLDMMAAIGPCNDGLKEQDLPPLSIRIGVSTGKMVVGDAGSKERSDYTVLGDAVNLGARLETANKAVGTGILISGRTYVLTSRRYLSRPIGRLQVVGRVQGEMVYEPLCPMDQATKTQHRLVAMTEVMVEAYIKCQLKSCLAAANAIDLEFGPGKVTQMYRKLCEAYLADPDGEKCDGQIVLQSK